MFKLLIVEDNDFERNALVNYINWSILGLEVVGFASDGQEGMEKAISLKPDIIISDIKMPNMTGIEMAKSVRAVNSQIRFLFSSGYEDIELLKQALGVQAYDYLLKPVRPEELIKAVKKIVDVLISEKLEDIETDRIKEQYRDNLHILQEKFLEELLLNETDNSQETAYYMQAGALNLRIKGKYSLVLVDLDYEEDKGGMSFSPRTDKIIKELKKNCQELDLFFVRLQYNQFAVLLHSIGEDLECIENCISLLEEQISGFKEKYNFKFTIGLSMTASQLTELNLLLGQCRSAVSKKVEKGHGRVVLYDSMVDTQDKLAHSDIGKIKNTISEVCTKVCAGGSAQEYIDELATGVSGISEYKLSSLQSIFIDLFSKISSQLAQVGEKFEEVADEEINVYMGIISCKTIPELRLYTEKMLNAVSAYQARKHVNKDDYTVNKILEILNAEYNQPITLSYLSERIYLSPNYLRILFKEKMKISVQDYLTNIRINKAKELLRNGHYKVYQIGEMVGYENNTYFNIIFKNYVNMTPGEYKNKFCLAKDS